jgi:hypothetical protein
MCGIVALLSRQRRISAEVLKRATKSLCHEAPMVSERFRPAA